MSKLTEILPRVVKVDGPTTDRKFAAELAKEMSKAIPNLELNLEPIPTDRLPSPLEASLEPEPLTAAVVQVETDSGIRYKVYLAPIGIFTGDDRIIFDLGWRDGRLPFTYSDSEMSHGDAVFVGNLEDFAYEERDGVQWVVAFVDWDNDPIAMEARRMVDEEKIRGVSIHLGAGFSTWFCRDEMSDTPSREEVIAASESFLENDEWETCLRAGIGVFEAEVGAATMVLIPAFEDAEVIPVLASAREIASLMSPPKEWFENPDLDRPSGIKIDSEGRVTGHLAYWNACHRGFRDQCVVPPKGSTGYSEFHKNATLVTEDGSELGAGCLTLDVHHADTSRSLDAAKAHYDHSGTVFAFVRAGEDEHGIWVSGVLAPGLEPEKVELARRLRLSGDWRPQNGSYELIAAQSVPVPGFVPRSLVASGREVRLSTVGPEANPIADETDEALIASALIAQTSILSRLIEGQAALEVGLGALVEEARQRQFSALTDSIIGEPEPLPTLPLLDE